MKKIKLISLIDKIFLTCTVFLVVFAWINFFIKNLATTFVFSLIISFAILFLFFYLFHHNNTKKTSKANYLKDVEEKFLAFSLLGLKDKVNIIYETINKRLKCEKHKDKIVCFDDTKKVVILFYFKSEKLTQFELINLIAGMFKYDEIKIICKDKNPALKLDIFKNSIIQIIDKKTLYDEYFLKYSTYPKSDFLNNEKPKANLKKILRNFISKNKSKSYLVCGFVLLFSCIILPYHLYYLIFGSMLIILSICCRFEHIIFR